MGDNREMDEVSFPPPSMVSEPRGYAMSGKIMLSAIVILFAVVIIMVCLHIYARWYLLRARRRQIRRARRRTHLVFYIEPSNPANIIPVPTRGLDPKVLHSLPTFKFKPPQHKGEDEEVMECAVCLCEFEEGERGRMLPKCSHSFHVDCIDMWFHSHSTCPICRAPIDAQHSPQPPPPVENVVIELTDSTRTQPDLVSESEAGPSEPGSEEGMRKFGIGKEMFGVTIQVPRRSQSFSFNTNSNSNSDESGPSPSPGFRSPTSRILSLKRILSRDKKSPLPSPTAAGSTRDVELGLVEAAQQPSHPT